ncbi:MAG: hypothetical protein ACR2NN_14210 [Bryobacteraceae bacterium]
MPVLLLLVLWRLCLQPVLESTQQRLEYSVSAIPGGHCADDIGAQLAKLPHKM